MKIIRQKLLNDTIINGFIGGLFGTLGDFVIHWLAFLLRITQSTTGHYLSQLFFPHQKVILPKLLIAEFTHFFTGGTLGIFIVLILRLTGLDFSLIKGIGFGVVMWIVHVIIIPNMVAPRPFLFRTFNEAIVDLVTHIVWGGLAAWFISKLYKKQKLQN